MTESPKIVPLFGAASAAPVEGPDLNIVLRLRHYADQAERGEIDCIAIALGRPNDGVETYWRRGKGGYRIYAAVMMLSHDMGHEINKVAMEDEE